MNWESLLKRDKSIDKLMEVYNSTPETWVKAKRINNSYWDLLNSYILAMVKHNPSKDIDYFTKVAQDWLNEMQDEKKMLKAEKRNIQTILPGDNLSKWKDLLTLEEVMFNQMLKMLQTTFKEHSFKGFQKPVLTYKKAINWGNAISVAKDLIPFSERRTDKAEFKKNRGLVKTNFEKLLPLMEEFKEFDTSQKSSAGKIKTPTKIAHAKLVDLLKDAAETLKQNQVPDWEEIETLMAKNYKSLQPRRAEKVKLMHSLGDKTIQTLIKYVPEDTPKLKAFFAHIKDDIEPTDYQIDDITPQEALNFIIKYATKKKIKSSSTRRKHSVTSLRIGLNLEKLLKGQKWKNKRTWLHPLLVGIMKQTSPIEELANTWFNNLSQIIIREDAVKDSYIRESWTKHSTGESWAKDGSEGLVLTLPVDKKMSEQDYKNVLEAQLKGMDKDNAHIKAQQSYIQSMKDKIKRIKNAVTKDFVDFIDILAVALQEDEPEGDNKLLVNAFLKAYSPEERVDFISKKQGRQNGGFGVVGGEKSPTQDKEGGGKQTVGLYKLPETEDKYAQIVKQLHDYLYSDSPPNNFRSLHNRFKSFRKNSDNRHLTKEFHLEGILGTIEDSPFNGAGILNTGSNLEKSVAYVLFDIFYTDTSLGGPKGLLTSQVQTERLLSNSDFVSVMDFLTQLETNLKLPNILRRSLDSFDSKYSEKEYTANQRKEMILSGDLDSNVKEITKAISDSLISIRDGLKDLVQTKIQNLIDNQLDSISRTYPELLKDLEKDGLIREA